MANTVFCVLLKTSDREIFTASNLITFVHEK